jgi:asparagine synthase (glutamine-hydrolysing)
MCGICGIISENRKVDFEEIKKMNDLLIHRGPDEEGFFLENNVALAMRRLSIIDLKTGKQPIFNETQDKVIVFNGEIYNFYNLKKELINKGHIFKTNSDTETIIHLYEEYGKNFVKYLRGMFAIAIWDRREKKLILVRDRLGKKPLFYYYDSNFFLFSSEINPILSFKNISLSINLKALDMYLTLQYIPAPYTIYNEIKKLEMSSILEFSNGKISIEKYWEIPKKTENISYNDAKEKLKQIVEEAVKLRLVSDVEVGAFLSGGIDSSIVVAIMSKYSNKKVKTFSIGFKEEKFNELAYARQVAKMYSTDHYEFIVEEELTDIIDNLIVNYGEPFADPSAIPSYYVSKIASRYLKVTLNGDGGDENFAGYRRYVALKIIENIKRYTPQFIIKTMDEISKILPEKNAPFNKVWLFRKFLKSIENKELLRSYISTVSFFDLPEKEEIKSNKFKSLTSTELPYNYLKNFFDVDGDLIKKMTYTDFNSYLPECLMMKMDIASMANSLETRSPLLDHILVEFTQTLPSNYKMKFLETKYIFKDTFKEMLPNQIKRRKKMGFSIPLGTWMRQKLKKKFEERCLSEKAFKSGLFQKEKIVNLWEEHQSFKKDHGYKLWSIFVFFTWYEKYFNDFRI